MQFVCIAQPSAAGNSVSRRGLVGQASACRDWQCADGLAFTDPNRLKPVLLFRERALELCYNRAAAKTSLQAMCAVETQAKRFYVSGRVQGVGFRFFAEATANRLGVGGFVRNLYDGRVEVYAIATAEKLDALRSALQRGPRMASVERLEEEEAEVLRNYAHVFSIEADE
jgi:acylphosphatase